METLMYIITDSDPTRKEDLGKLEEARDRGRNVDKIIDEVYKQSKDDKLREMRSELRKHRDADKAAEIERRIKKYGRG